MRNRRLLTLAVLAVAIGFSAYAQAADNTDPYGIAVLTVIKAPDASTPLASGTFTINIRLWDDAGGIGATAQTPGLLDFAIKTIAGTGGLIIDEVTSLAPFGSVAATAEHPHDDTNTYGGGFSNVPSGDPAKPVGINYAGQNYGDDKQPIGNSFNAVGMQPVAYGPLDANANTLRDAAVLYGVGTVGRAAGLTTTQNGVGEWIADPAPAGGIDGDTPIVSGSYTETSTPGSIATTTWGTLSFDVLPGGPTAVFEGPAVDANTFGRPVKAVVVITTSSGNVLDGGKNVATVPTTLEVQAGNVLLGAGVQLGTAATAGTAAVANTTLILNAGLSESVVEGVTVVDPNVSITLGASQIVAGLQMTTANPGNQALDLKSPTDSGQYHSLSIYSGDTTTADLSSPTEVAILGLIQTGKDSLGTEGLYDSSMSLHANSAIGVTDQAFDADGGQYILVRPTILGDANLDGETEFGDMLILGNFLNWQQAGTTWDRGDFNGDGETEFGDMLILGNFLNWQQAYTPEPASMLLLAVGAVGVLARRRRK